MGIEMRMCYTPGSFIQVFRWFMDGEDVNLLY